MSITLRAIQAFLVPVNIAIKRQYYITIHVTKQVLCASSQTSFPS